MKYGRIGLTIIAGLISTQALCADDFSGLYIGGKAGWNQSHTDGTFSTDNADAVTLGAELGYNWTIGDSFLVGVDAFYDWTDQRNHDLSGGGTAKYGSNAGGADLKLGLPFDRWLPYVKLGYGYLDGTGANGTFGAGGFHGGAGLEYKLAPNWGLAGEWTSVVNPSDGGTKVRSNSFTLNLNYYFGGPAPAPMPVAEPMPAPAPAPAPEPAPAPAPQLVTKHFTLKADVMFQFAKATLKQEGKDALDKLYDQVKEMDPKDGKAIVVGYTDRIGSEKYNMDLGQRRAQSVVDYLISKGTPADKIEAQSRGEADPVTGDTCAKIKNRKKLIECLAPDRRVEIDVQGMQEVPEGQQ